MNFIRGRLIFAVGFLKCLILSIVKLVKRAFRYLGDVVASSPALFYLTVIISVLYMSGSSWVLIGLKNSENFNPSEEYAAQLMRFASGLIFASAFMLCATSILGRKCFSDTKIKEQVRNVFVHSLLFVFAFLILAEISSQGHVIYGDLWALCVTIPFLVCPPMLKLAELLLRIFPIPFLEKKRRLTTYAELRRLKRASRKRKTMPHYRLQPGNGIECGVCSGIFN